MVREPRRDVARQPTDNHSHPGRSKHRRPAQTSSTGCRNRPLSCITWRTRVAHQSTEDNHSLCTTAELAFQDQGAARAQRGRPRSACWRRKRRHRPARRPISATVAGSDDASGGGSGFWDGWPPRPPSTQAEPSRPAPGWQGRSSGRALHLATLGQARSTVCGSTWTGWLGRRRGDGASWVGIQVSL